jgi:hypothetical protein
MRAPRALSAVIAVFAALVLAGCGASPSQQVKAKVQEFAAAVRKGDYATICHRVLAPSLLDRLAGTRIPCPRALRLALSGVEDPTLAIGQVSVHGQSASVLTLAMARRQRASVQAIRLVRTSAGWRIASLQSAVGSAPPQPK